MLPSSSSVSQIQQYVRAQQGVIEVARATPDQLLVTVGERVQAMVTGQLPNGRFTVLVKDQMLDLNLPSNTQPGEQLELVVSGKEPRLTFTLVQSQAQAQSLSQSGARQVGVALSDTARMLGELATKPEGQARTATLQQSQPLFDGVPQPEKLASALASRLAESGLFYESHQAEWVKGDRHLQTLLREPQARLTAGDVLFVKPGNFGGGGDQTLLREPPARLTEGDVSLAKLGNSGGGDQTLLRESQVGLTERDVLLSKPDSPDSHVMRDAKLPVREQLHTNVRVQAGISLADVEHQSSRSSVAPSDLPQTVHTLQMQSSDQNVRQLVQQQLALLENNPLVWQGQAWAGQPLHWKTELQNEGSRPGSEEGTARVWQTRLDLTLPRLGELGVSATLRDGQFDLRFEASDPATVKMLRDAQTLLAGRFEAAGLKLSASQVYQHVDETDN